VFATPRANAHDWQWRLLYVGRPHPDKGVEDAVRSLERMPENATLTFAGNWYPRDEAALAQSVDRLGLAERVRILPRLPREEIAQLYRSSDVLLFPVRWEEPWGLVPLEAMACGCPVIATARGGSAEYMQDGENCLVVPVADPSSLAGAVARLASDGKLRERLRRGGSLTASRHGEEAFNRAVEAHLLEAVQRGPARTSVTAGPRRAAGAEPTAGSLRS
jgi:glycosyltransferase involved in cell wall biosynthesis